MPAPPIHPNVQRQLKARLMALSPRAFELFAGDLLTYIGLKHVAVTRYVGDGGVDAHGDLMTDSGLVCVPTGVQVKRHRANVQRADIDRFIGALSGQYRHGIFITTADYAAQARIKAQTSPLLRVDTITGEDVVALMHRHQLGMCESAAAVLDEDYFLSFEAQSTVQRHIVDSRTGYAVNSPSSATTIARSEDDLISLRALSYVLRVDTTTIRRWIEKGKLQPDQPAALVTRDGFFFRRDRIEAIRRQFLCAAQPSNASDWRQAFLDFAQSRNLTKSYKPVLLRALLQLVDRNGEIQLDALVQAFKAFYIQRQQHNLPIEFNVPLLANPSTVSDAEIKKLLIRYPLERFIIQGFLEYLPNEGRVRFAPQLWRELRFYELLDVQRSVEAQLDYYYATRLSEKGNSGAFFDAKAQRRKGALFLGFCTRFP